MKKRAPVDTRRFSIADGMIVVAASAIAAAWVRGEWNPVDVMVFNAFDPAVKNLDIRVALAQYAAVRTLIPLTIAWLLMRLRRPRPARRRLWRQPGWAGCSAAGLAILIQVAVALPTVAWKGSLSWWMVYLWCGQRQLSTVGLIVCLVWAALALDGRWRPDRHWIDRSGRLIGLTWAVVGVASLAYDTWFTLRDVSPPFRNPSRLSAPRF